MRWIIDEYDILSQVMTVRHEAGFTPEGVTQTTCPTTISPHRLDGITDLGPKPIMECRVCGQKPHLPGPSSVAHDFEQIRKKVLG